MKEKLELANEFLIQAGDLLDLLIRAQSKKVQDLREVELLSIQLTQAIDFLSRLRSLQEGIKSIQKKVQREIHEL